MKIGIIGYGRMGKLHHRMLESIIGDKSDAGVKRIFIRDVNYSDIFKYNLDGIIISAPNFAHKEIAEKCADKGISILCEKPLGKSLSDTEDIVKLSKDILVYPAITHRFRFGNESASEVSVTWTSKNNVYIKDWMKNYNKTGGGVVLDYGSHYLYTALDFMQPEDWNHAKIHATGNLSAAKGTIQTNAKQIKFNFAYKSEQFSNEIIKVSTKASYHMFTSWCPEICYYQQDLDFINCLKYGKEPIINLKRFLQTRKLIDRIEKCLKKD